MSKLVIDCAAIILFEKQKFAHYYEIESEPLCRNSNPALQFQINVVKLQNFLEIMANHLHL